MAPHLVTPLSVQVRSLTATSPMAISGYETVFIFWNTTYRPHVYKLMISTDCHLRLTERITYEEKIYEH